MELTHQDLLHLAHLSNFSLSQKELKAFQVDLKNIVQYISELKTLDTKNIQPTFQVFEMENVWHSDQVQPSDPDALLNLAPEILNHQIKVPKIL